MVFESWPVPPGGWPRGFWDVPYNVLATPSATEPRSWLDGSNCQRFAYGVLGMFGRQCPPFASSDLWDEASTTRRVDDPRPLDIVLFNHSSDPYGAHLGLWMDSDEILHLCHEIARPVVWSLEEFVRRPRYRHLIGFKRVRRDVGTMRDHLRSEN